MHYCVVEDQVCMQVLQTRSNQGYECNSAHMCLTCIPVRFSEGKSGAELQKLVGISDGGPKIITFDELMRQGKLKFSVISIYYMYLLRMYTCVHIYTYTRTHAVTICVQRSVT